jgi:hypothetical protein
MEHRRNSWYNGEVILGIALLVLGILFFMDNAEIIDMGPVWNYWPFVLVALGAGKFLNADGTKQRIEGAWLAFIGLWLFVSMNHVLGLSFSNSWPLLVIAWGVTILWRGSLCQSHMQTHSEESRGQ